MPARRPTRKSSASAARAVRAPLQERSQQSLERMLDAAEALIHERGFDALTVGELVQRSRTSVGSFYARFEDKAALLRVVHDRVLGRLEANFEERARTRPAATSLAGCVHDEVASFVRLANLDAPLVRAFMGQQADPVILARAARTERRHFALFRAALIEHVDEIKHEDPEAAIRFAFVAYVNVAILLSWTFGTPQQVLSETAAATELSRMVLGYLVGSGQPRAAPKPRSRGAL